MTNFQQMTDSALCDFVRAGCPGLDDKNQSFAEGLSESIARRGLASPKQRYWLEWLAKLIENPKVDERVKTPVGDLKGVMELFDRAAKKLKSPAIVIQIADIELRLNVAGSRARAPGTVNVASNDGWGDSKWFGRILQSGEFEASPREPTPAGLIEGLARFAAHPAEVAAEHGRLTGKCCFCNTGLTDPRSTEVGYGPTCAKNYGLAWGARARTERELFGEAA